MSARPSVLVAGAGVFGSAIALELARGGHAVTLADPAGLGDNASGAAGGMLAPAFEALLDPLSAGHFNFMRAARDLWPAFVGDGGEAAVGLSRGGAVWLALPDDPPELVEARRAGLAALGAAVEPWTAAQLAERGLGLDPAISAGVFTPEDWRLAPLAALGWMQSAAEAAGGARLQATVSDFSAGQAELSDGRRIAVDVLVVATGAEASALAPELAVLAPIKGHILRYPAGLLARGGPSLRCRLGYATGGADGVCVGATMEAGLNNRTIDPLLSARLIALAHAIAPATPMAGVRAASPDGLPLVGRSARPGVFLAVGARRNGWLLAPLVAGLIAAYLAARDPGPYASVLDAARFTTA